jgi:hypothetical protein
MNRSPLFFPMSRGMDADAGGAADLQTDVMRFMAIISMCLVAIFALVQSIPLSPPADVPPVVPVEAETIVARDPPAEPAPQPDLQLTRPAPAQVATQTERIVLQRPAFKPAAKPVPPPDRVPPPVAKAATPASAPAVRPAQPSSTQKGFTLRFESDRALMRLVARNVVGLYAISSGQAQRMSIESEKLSFWPASTPDQYHEMDAQTVPAAVVSAYGRSRSGGAAGASWGVSLPAAMSRQLEQYLAKSAGGSLIIGQDGALRLEP